MDINSIRSQFPILSREVHKKPLVYLDNGATTQKPQMVIDAISNYYETINSNVHRGVHHLSQLATDAFEKSRITVQEFIGANSIKEVIITKGTTESINLLAYSFGDAFIHEGDEIIVSELEHHANIVPWQLLCQRKKAVLKVIPVNEKGDLEMDVFESLLSEKTKLVSVAHVSNALGTINPIATIIEKAHQAGAKVHIDGAQAVAHTPLNLKELDVDFYSFSAHKMYGPMGIGIFFGKEELLDQMPPWQSGGEMIDKVTFEKTTFNELPYKFEPGTPNVDGMIGLESSIHFLQTLGIENIKKAEDELLAYGTEKLSAIKGLKIIGTADKKASVISFLLDNIHPFDAGTIIDHMGVAVRTGNHCAQPIMDKIGIPGTIRASISIYNTKEDINRLVEAIEKTQEMFA
ncbi:cysteine desulfurase [Lentimicrobium sp. L6]|uniref:cysteine desulfurase n=1 Tax=Lentimicrobium sp. L6 TaxID=2735916 RepID=UPI00155594D7|nr:cysteine desulfurase [Lentimicrobium sp. L6]NPD85621.1 cysteine desulfurase [Lentimicrobium sp. L6]